MPIVNPVEPVDIARLMSGREFPECQACGAVWKGEVDGWVLLGDPADLAAAGHAPVLCPLCATGF